MEAWCHLRGRASLGDTRRETLRKLIPKCHNILYDFTKVLKRERNNFLGSWKELWWGERNLPRVLQSGTGVPEARRAGSVGLYPDQPRLSAPWGTSPALAPSTLELRMDSRPKDFPHAGGPRQNTCNIAAKDM